MKFEEAKKLHSKHDLYRCNETLKRHIWRKETLVELLFHHLDRDELLNFDIYDLEAEDWEIYEEEDSWNLNDCNYNWEEHNNYVNSMSQPMIFKGIGYKKQYIETLKEKILQDFCDLKNTKIENNICYASYDDIENIINKRFGF